MQKDKLSKGKLMHLVLDTLDFSRSWDVRAGAGAVGQWEMGNFGIHVIRDEN